MGINNISIEAHFNTLQQSKLEEVYATASMERLLDRFKLEYKSDTLVVILDYHTDTYIVNDERPHRAANDVAITMNAYLQEFERYDYDPEILKQHFVDQEDQEYWLTQVKE